jgi:WD40 repeat protein/class 3 adenylate cyclase
VAALAQYENLSRLLMTELGVEPSAETTALYNQIRIDALPSIDTIRDKPQPEHEAEILDTPSMPVFLFTDIENSTPLWDEHREAMLDALLQHNAILDEQIALYGGRILELRGDGVKAVFEGGQPLESAVAIQRAFNQEDWGEIGQLRIRIGLHGVQVDWEGYDYFREGGVFFGPVLNYAARVMDAGWGGQILVSKNIESSFDLPAGAAWQDYGECQLKGMEEPIHIYGLLDPDLPHQSFPGLRIPGEQVADDDQDGSGAKLATSAKTRPYRGLFAFREEDAPFFYGREAFTGMLLEAIREQSMVAVVGPSGSGKSSVVHAGLLAQLRGQGNWLITSFRPGDRPFRSLAGALVPYLEPDLSRTDQLVETNKLAEALSQGDVSLMDVVNNILAERPPGTRLPLVGDQFEELYTLVPEHNLRTHFMDVLTDAVFDQQYRSSPVFSFILTLRADFMGQALAHRPFADALQETDVILGPMTQGELGRAIINPAKRLNVHYEAGLVPRILDDVGQEPGNLPLLEFALAMLWDKRESDMLTHQAYEAIDRVDGALARHADAIFDALSSDEQQSARRIFIQVVRPGEGTEDTRRLASRAELGEADWVLVQHLADSRLLVTSRDAEGEETVEVVHEALIRGWGRLRKWMEADRDFRVWQERLRAAIRQWEASDRDEGAMLRGVTLDTAEGWMAERPADLSQVELEYIETSGALRVRRQADETKRLKRERDLEQAALRRLRVIVAVLVIASVIGITLTIAVFNQSRIARQRAEENAVIAATAQAARSEAITQQELAESNAAESLSLALAANALQAQEVGNYDLALALALEAVDIENPPNEAVRGLQEIAFGPGTLLLMDNDGVPVSSFALLPDGKRVISGSEDGAVRLWSLETEEGIYHFEGHTNEVEEIAISDDGKIAVSASADGSLIVWDLEAGKERLRFDGHSGRVMRVFLSPDGDRALSLAGDLNQNEDIVSSSLIAWDTNTGEEIYRLENQPDHIRHMEVSPDGRVALLGLSECNSETCHVGSAEAILWDVNQGEEISSVEFDSSEISGVWNVAITPDGDTGLVMIIEKGEDPTNFLEDRFFGLFVDMKTGQIRKRFEISENALDYPIYSPDGKLIAVEELGSEEIVILSAETGQEIQRMNSTDGGGHTAPLTWKIFSPDSRTLLTAGADTLNIWWDVNSGAKILQLAGHNALVNQVTFGSDGNNAISASEDGTLRLWNMLPPGDIETTTAARHFEGHSIRDVSHVALSPNGQKVVSVAKNPEGEPTAESLVWDIHSGEILHQLELIEDVVLQSVEVSPDGQFAILGGASGIGRPSDESSILILWNITSGEEYKRFELPDSGLIWHLDISKDGRTALSGSGDAVHLWDLESGEEIGRFAGHNGPGSEGTIAFSVAFAPDGLRALSGGGDGDIILWDLETGEEIRRYEHGGFVVNLAFSPDGKQFVSTSTDLSIVLWDFESGQVLRRFTGHENGVSSAAFTPNGTRLISSSADGTLILWDVATGEQLRRFEEHENFVWKVILTPDGRTAISSGGDGLVISRPIEDLSLADVIKYANDNRYIPELTCDQRIQYRIDPPCEAE